MFNKTYNAIAFYLPQFHPTEHNDEWWGKGFTEWTNVAKAKPLFCGHYQPKIPADLGFYDLRIPKVRSNQVELAKKAGVTGFCYYHYWFGNGHQELELPFNEVVQSGEPDFPFCLCWANETWSRKFWNKDGNVAQKQDLAIQQYLGILDNTNHFMSLISAFKDKRYIKFEGKPIFMIYKPLNIPNFEELCDLWNKLAHENGLPGIHFIAYTTDIENEYSELKRLGFNTVCSCRIGYGKQCFVEKYLRKIFSVIFNIPRVFSYKTMYPQFIGQEEVIKEDVYPTLIPNWDHTPRSKEHGYLYQNATPKLFYEHACDVLRKIKNKKNVVFFIKSWNEWGEGNYMEPDLRYGHGYINALKDAIFNILK